MNLRFYLRGLGLGIVVTALLMGYTLGGHKQSLTDDEIRERAAMLGMVEDDGVLVSMPSASEPSEDAEGVKTTEDSGKTPAENTDPEGILVETADKPEPEADTETETDTAGENAPSPDKTEAEKPSETEEISAETKTADATPVPDKEEDKTETAKEGRNGETTHELTVTGSVAGAEETNEKEPETPSPTPTPTPTPTGASGASEGKTGSSSKGGTLRIVKGSDSYEVAKQLEKAGLVDDAEAFDAYLCRKGLDRFVIIGSFEIPAGAGYDQIAKLITGR
ncbi:MAG: hypothetical protein K6G83_00245 [Lachnospiraceae bacterium]|nr:hypothetical protein [Lachnospiraceae bacterium]